ncbi:MAG: Gfo/Idh/MocA family oxidoreductase [Acidobacteria bacterium]|nr:Gfo/Idh/MocA family oxidoreductase [Acidobacteriota bacterium]
MTSAAPKPSRRHFVQSASAAAGWMIVQPQSVRGSQANSAVAVGVIGVGGRGTYDAGIFVNDPRARVTALCDKFDDRLDEGATKLKLEKPALFKDYEKLLATGVDAVLIATPPFEHPRMFEAAVEARKHIYCEKPMGVDVAGCKRVMAAAKKADPTKNIAVGFQQRYGPVYLEAYRRIQEGQIGELSVARGAWIGGNPFKKKPYPDPEVEHLRNWFCYKDYSGDFIVEQDCHNFDVLHWFLGGLPLRAVGWGGTKARTELEILDHLSLTFEFPNGLHVNYEANQISPPGFSNVGEEFTGTKGTIATSRARMIHYKGPNDAETIQSQRDITIDAIEDFLSRILSGKVENVGVRSAESTLIAILGRTAIYTGREASWKEIVNS